MNKVQSVIGFARRKMIQHGLSDWTFELGRAKRIAGTCYRDLKVIRMSRVLINARSLDDSYNTVLHEIAHALTPGHGHDRVWKQMAITVGARPEACYDSSTVDKSKIKYKYTYRCSNGHEVQTSRKLKNIHLRYCLNCRDTRNKIVRFTETQHY